MSIRRLCSQHNLKRKGHLSDTELESAVIGSVYTGARNLNPVPYHAEDMGHKLHLDQNEKLGMFGVTHVLAVDGYSSKIVAKATMPVKNNLVIYEQVYRSAVVNYGMWDQLRVDHGREFYMCLYMQEKLSRHRHNLSRQPYLQTTSTRNLRVERI
ncbi:hypothetical protein QQF64_023871 [Cirrhinus molitorella]|uniref:Integrase core domain-containing protein n=1 Tax=Cirrhinus molitorella TaxID=172907 RepID=A0ABR3NJL9_9TELE